MWKYQENATITKSPQGTKRRKDEEQIDKINKDKIIHMYDKTDTETMKNCNRGTNRLERSLGGLLGGGGRGMGRGA